MRRAFSALLWPIALTGVIIAGPARAQDIHIIAPAERPPAGDAQSSPPLTPSESSLLGSALMFDPANLTAPKPAPALRVPTLVKPRNLSVKGSENPDGTSKVAIKQPVVNGEWDANVGADLRTAAATPTSFVPGKPFPGNIDDRGSTAAWASVGVPNVAAVDARVDPATDQGQVGAALKHALPIGDQLSLTVQNRVSVTDSYGLTPVAPAPLSDLPLMAAPKSTDPIAPGPTQVFGTERSVKLDIKSTGTSFGAGLTSASNDPTTHNTFSADQQLFGPLHVTTAVTDVGQATSNKSISAKFKLDW